MDDELRAYLDAMRSEFNDAQERLLNRLAAEQRSQRERDRKADG